MGTIGSPSHIPSPVAEGGPYWFVTPAEPLQQHQMPCGTPGAIPQSRTWMPREWKAQALGLGLQPRTPVSLLASAVSGPLQAAHTGQKVTPNCPSGPHLCMSWLPLPPPLQMTSPLARGLFHRAISQSGTAALQIFITPDPLKVAKVSASSLLRFSKGGRMGTPPSTSSLHRRLPSWQAAITTAQRFS